MTAHFILSRQPNEVGVAGCAPSKSTLGYYVGPCSSGHHASCIVLHSPQPIQLRLGKFKEQRVAKSKCETTKAWTVICAATWNSEQVVEMDIDWLPNCLDR